MATAVAMYPVDLVRALKMSSAAEGGSIPTLLKNFYAQHGAKGFVSQGVGPEMARATYMRVLKFFLFPIMHRNLFGTDVAQGNPGTKAVAAALASLPEGLTIAPLETAKIGLQLDKSNKFGNSASNVMKHVMETRGWTGLWSGYFGVQYRQTSWTVAYFATLSSFQNMSKSIVPEEYKKVQQLSGGFMAGMFGAVFNTPGDVIRSTIQKRMLNEANPGKQTFTPGLLVSGVTEFFATGRAIAAAQGPGALYSGFPVKAMHLGGSGALLATLIPLFKNIMGVN